MKSNCLNCHFLIREGISLEIDDFNQKYQVALLAAERENLKTKICLPNRNAPSRYRCERGIWDSASYSDIDKLREDIFDKKRNNCPYYSIYSEGMELETLKDIQKKSKQDKNIRNANILAIIAIVISLMGVITAIVALFK